MTTPTVERIETDIGQLSLSEQLWLMERLAQQIRQRTLANHSFLESQLAVMASDPDIQRVLRQIEAEFAIADVDGLDIDQ